MIARTKDKDLGSLAYAMSSIIEPLFIEITYQQEFYLKKKQVNIDQVAFTYF